jgi:hypothetical protein
LWVIETIFTFVVEPFAIAEAAIVNETEPQYPSAPSDSFVSTPKFETVKDVPVTVSPFSSLPVYVASPVIGPKYKVLSAEPSFTTTSNVVVLLSAKWIFAPAVSVLIVKYFLLCPMACNYYI